MLSPVSCSNTLHHCTGSGRFFAIMTLADTRHACLQDWDEVMRTLKALRDEALRCRFKREERCMSFLHSVRESFISDGETSAKIPVRSAHLQICLLWAASSHADILSSIPGFVRETTSALWCRRALLEVRRGSSYASSWLCT